MSHRGLEDVDVEGFEDDEYDPHKRPKSKGERKERAASASVQAEHGRALHTLDEAHHHLLFGALDSSLTGSVQGPHGLEPSSSQLDGGFGFEDVFALPDGVGGADIGDELAREASIAVAA